MQTRRKWFYRILFMAALAVFLFSGARLVLIFLDYQKGALEYEELKEFTADAVGGSGINIEETESEEGESHPSFSVDFAGLKARNKDCVGWIRFEQLEISYPILQGSDNEYYLNHTFHGEKRTAASIFLDYQNKPDFTDTVSFVYGHNMKDGTMFAKLNQFGDEGFYQVNPYFWVYTPAAAYRYDIFSCYVSDVEDPLLQDGFNGEEEYEDWLSKVKAKSNYDTGISVGKTDKVIVLMTCNRAGDDYRFLVYGVQRESIPTVQNGE